MHQQPLRTESTAGIGRGQDPPEGSCTVTVKKKTRKQGSLRRERVADVIGRPIEPELVVELRTQLGEVMAVMYQLNGALRYEQRRIAAKERRELYRKAVVVLGRGLRAGVSTAGRATVHAGQGIKAGATWLFSKKAETETAMA